MTVTVARDGDVIVIRQHLLPGMGAIVCHTFKDIQDALAVMEEPAPPTEMNIYNVILKKTYTITVHAYNPENAEMKAQNLVMGYGGKLDVLIRDVTPQIIFVEKLSS